MFLLLAEANKQAAVIEGESEYMKTLSAHITMKVRQSFIPISESGCLKVSLQGEDKTIILDKDSAIAKLFY